MNFHDKLMPSKVAKTAYFLTSNKYNMTALKIVGTEATPVLFSVGSEKMM
jgi:hypothetical protein